MKLGDIEEAINQGNIHGALDDALEAWRETKTAALADLVHALSAKVATPLEGPDHEAWIKRATDATSADVGPLLDGLLEPGVSTLAGRVDRLVELPPDPRVTMKFGEMAFEPPFTSSSQFHVWTKIFDYLKDVGDARVRPLLEKRLTLKPGGSQFWPKLYRNVEKILKKLPVAPKEADSAAKAIAALIEAVAKAEAKAPAAKKKKSAAATKATSFPATLDGAVAAVNAGDLRACLDALLVVWRGQRLAAFGLAVERVGDLLDEGRAPPGGTDKNLEKAWQTLAASHASADVGLLADSAVDGRALDAEARLDTMLTWPEDPRIGRSMLVTAMRHVFSDRLRAWKGLVDLMARNADPRYRVHIDDFAKAGGDNKARRSQLHRAAKELTKALEGVPETPTSKEILLLDQLDAALDAFVAKQPHSERKFLDEIMSTPLDDGPRLVYADWLTERGHPRGELITLQCAPETPETAKRIKELIWEHPRALLGPAAALAFGSYLRYSAEEWLSRGLVTKIRSSTNAPAWAFANSPLMWAVEEVSGSVSIATLLGCAKGLRTLANCASPILAEICASTEPLAIERLRIIHREDLGGYPLMGLPASAAAMLPKLKEIEIMWWQGPPQYSDEFFESPLLANLESLYLSTTNLGWFVAGLRKAKSQVRSVKFLQRTYVPYWVEVVLDAAMTPTLVRVGAFGPKDTGGNDTGKSLIDVLNSLPPGVPVEVGEGVRLSETALARTTS